ncbi:MAG: divalent-cation tolerance protein CutA [Parcubacteria group bacterium]|jgi:periplasmic divalent cation tolerance protein|nr:divalent-cation tolerance protein CutA [Parcubacteria group bacterium]|tara:strand:- start:210 stop:521 length:312 start_codon:yes stop_codon:yes gene_type:complete
MPFITVYTTNKNLAEAKKIANSLLKQKLIACANFFPIKNMYWWKGKIENDNEVVSILKTRKENWNKVKNQIKKLHSYEVPCIEKFNVSANKDYENWIIKSTKK